MCFLRRSRLPFGRPQKPQTPPQAYMPQPCVSKGVQGCRLPAFKLLNRPASLSKATTFAATGPSHVFFTAFETAVWPPAKASNPSTGLHVQGNHFRSYRPQPCVFYGVPDCRLAARKSPKPLHRPTCLSHAFLKAFKAAVCLLSNF